MPFDNAPQHDPETDTVLAILRAAHAYLTRDRAHWCQKFARSGEARCAAEATEMAKIHIGTSDHVRKHAYHLLAATIQQQCLIHYDSVNSYLMTALMTAVSDIALIAYYNDLPTTQYADILALFQHTIDRLEQAQ